MAIPIGPIVKSETSQNVLGGSLITQSGGVLCAYGLKQLFEYFGWGWPFDTDVTLGIGWAIAMFGTPIVSRWIATLRG